MVWRPLGQNYFQNNTKIWFAFFTFIFSGVHIGVFQKPHNVWYHKRLNAEAETRIQLSSIKPDTKGICKNAKQYHSSHWFFSLWNIQLFLLKIFCLTCHGLSIVILKIHEIYSLNNLLNVKYIFITVITMLYNRSLILHSWNSVPVKQQLPFPSLPSPCPSPFYFLLLWVWLL